MNMSQEVILQVKKVNKSFGGVKAVHDVSFDLFKGEILGVIGPNGSGKTTLINIISGFIKPDSGEVFFKDKNLIELPPNKIADLGVTRTFQIVRPYHSLPAFKNIVIPLWSRRARRLSGGKHGDRDAVAIDLLEEVGFEREANVPYKIASSLPLGYLKRLELSRCLALRPEVVMCDEVLSGLSMAEILTLIPLIERLQTDGITLIMVEHRIRELFSVANRVIVMNFGVKIGEGPPEEVLARKEVREAYLGKGKKRKKKEN